MDQLCRTGSAQSQQAFVFSTQAATILSAFSGQFTNQGFTLVRPQILGLTLNFSRSVAAFALGVAALALVVPAGSPINSVNDFVQADEPPIPTLYIDERTAETQLTRLAELKRTRNNDAVQRSLDALKAANEATRDAVAREAAAPPRTGVRTCAPRAFMAKKIQALVKLQIAAGKATPAPPVGTALGPQGVNIMEFCKAFNAQTQQGYEPGMKLPVIITAFADKSFTFIIKTPPATTLIKKAVKLDKGSSRPHVDKVGKITRAQLEEIAKTKMEDLNAADLDAAVRIIAGSARSMGVTVEGV